jgi:MFS family permease
MTFASMRVVVAQPSSSSSGYAWYVVAVLTFVYMTAFVDRQIVSLLVGPIKQTLGVTDTQMGLLQGLAFGIFYTLLGVPIGRLADQRSRRAIIATGCTIWSIMTAACGLARTFPQLFLARIGVGVGEATISPAALSMIGDYFPKDRRPLAMSLFVSAGSIGSAVALLMGGAVIGWANTLAVELPIIGRLHGWQIIFMLVGLPGLIGTALMLTVREPVRTGASASTADWGHLWAFMARHRWVLAGHIGGFAIFSTLVYAVMFWGPSFFVRQHGWTEKQVGLSYGIGILVFGLLGAFAGGAFAGWLRRRGAVSAALLTVAVGAGGITVPGVLGVTIPDANVAIVFACLCNFFVSFASGSSAAAFQEYTPNELRAQITAVYYFAINLVGLSLGGVSVGVLNDYVFGSEAAIGRSLLVVLLIMGPLGGGLIAAALPAFRRAVLRFEDGTPA